MCIRLGHCLHFASLAKINAYGKKFLQRSEVIEKFIPIYSCYNTFCTLSFIQKLYYLGRIWLWFRWRWEQLISRLISSNVHGADALLWVLVSDVWCSLHCFHGHWGSGLFLLKATIIIIIVYGTAVIINSGRGRGTTWDQIVPANHHGERRSADVFAVVLDGHVVFARSHWHIGDFVTVIYLVTAQIHFAWTIHCNG